MLAVGLAAIQTSSSTGNADGRTCHPGRNELGGQTASAHREGIPSWWCKPSHRSRSCRTGDTSWLKALGSAQEVGGGGGVGGGREIGRASCRERVYCTV